MDIMYNLCMHVSKKYIMPFKYTIFKEVFLAQHVVIRSRLGLLRHIIYSRTQKVYLYINILQILYLILTIYFHILLPKRKKGKCFPQMDYTFSGRQTVNIKSDFPKKKTFSVDFLLMVFLYIYNTVCGAMPHT